MLHEFLQTFTESINGKRMVTQHTITLWSSLLQETGTAQNLIPTEKDQEHPQLPQATTANVLYFRASATSQLLEILMALGH